MHKYAHRLNTFFLRNICPPLPTHEVLKDLRTVAEVCDRHGVSATVELSSCFLLGEGEEYVFDVLDMQGPLYRDNRCLDINQYMPDFQGITNELYTKELMSGVWEHIFHVPSHLLGVQNPAPGDRVLCNQKDTLPLFHRSNSTCSKDCIPLSAAEEEDVLEEWLDKAAKEMTQKRKAFHLQDGEEDKKWRQTSSREFFIEKSLLFTARPDLVPLLVLRCMAL